MGRTVTSVIIVVLFLAAIASIFFVEDLVPKDLVEEYGVLVYAAPLVVVIVLIIIIIFVSAIGSKIKTSIINSERQNMKVKLESVEKKIVKIDVDSKVKGKSSSDEIAKLKRSLKEGAKEIARKDKLSIQKKKEDELDLVEEDLFSQLSDEK